MKTKRNILIFFTILAVICIELFIALVGYMAGYYQAKQEDKTVMIGK